MENKWAEPLRLLIQQYAGRKHPLDYKSRYQLVVMVILSAQDSDKHINELAPSFFAVYPDMQTFALDQPQYLYPLLSSMQNCFEN